MQSNFRLEASSYGSWTSFPIHFSIPFGMQMIGVVGKTDYCFWYPLWYITCSRFCQLKL